MDFIVCLLFFGKVSLEVRGGLEFKATEQRRQADKSPTAFGAPEMELAGGEPVL
jgi:hypothetical protein